MVKIDTDKEILSFIVNNKDTKAEVSKSTYGLDMYTVLNFSLINDGEYIKTDANEVPNSNGNGWHYNGDCTYDYVYCIVDNKILSIEFASDLEYGDPKSLVLNLYPNANNYTIQTKKGHRSNSYVQFVNKDGNAINSFTFETPREDLSDFDGLGIADIITPVTTDELIARYNQRHSDKVFKI